MGNSASRQKEFEELDAYIQNQEFEGLVIEDNLLDYPRLSPYIESPNTSNYPSAQLFALVLLINIIRNLREKEFLPDYDTLCSILKDIFIGLPALTHEDMEDRQPKFINQVAFVKGLLTSLWNSPQLGTGLIVSRLELEYEFRGRLGHGAFGEVVRAFNKLDSKEYAIKKIKINTKTNSDKLLREVQVLAKLVHQNVVRYHSVWVDYETKEDTATRPNESYGSESSYVESDVFKRSTFVESSQGSNVVFRENTQENSNYSIGDESNRSECMEKTFPNPQELHSNGSGLVVFAENSNTQSQNNETFTENTNIRSQNNIIFTDKSNTQSQNVFFSENSNIQSQNNIIFADNSNTQSQSNVLFTDTSNLRSRLSPNPRNTAMNLISKGAFRNRPIIRHNSLPLNEIKPATLNKSKSCIPSSNFPLAKCAPTHPEVFPILCILLELCESNLKEWLLERNARCSTFWDLSQGDLENSDDFTVQLFQGLSYIHSKGYIHRDIKPTNILLSKNSKVLKIGDFGLSKENDEIPTSKSPHKHMSTCSNHTSQVGTRLYTSPEQSSTSEYSSKTDIFSSALVMLELYNPFTTDSERYQNIDKLRKTQLEDNFKHKFPFESNLMLRMVNLDWDKRPCADEVLNLLFVRRRLTITDLKQILVLKDELLMSKDKRIAELEAEIQCLTAK